MTDDDRNLVERAARAAGIPLEFRVLKWSDGSEYPCYEDKDSVCVTPIYTPVIKWNPLQDDGDALRLSVAMGMNLYINDKYCIAEILSDSESPPIHQNEYCDSETKNAATRRAIVRAAEEIGKAMQ